VTRKPPTLAQLFEVERLLREGVETLLRAQAAAIIYWPPGDPVLAQLSRAVAGVQAVRTENDRLAYQVHHVESWRGMRRAEAPEATP
jgi:hypothetical protein